MDTLLTVKYEVKFNPPNVMLASIGIFGSYILLIYLPPNQMSLHITVLELTSSAWMSRSVKSVWDVINGYPAARVIKFLFASVILK